MDSGNSSGSLQSSSGGCGGDDDYDSRAAFFNHPPPPPPPFGFDIIQPSSNYLDPIQPPPPPPSSLPNFDMGWPKPARPDPIRPADLAAFNNHPFSSSHTQQPLLPESSSGAGAGGDVRNPKKRSRASRRAPTTVLTTDTANFRAMVQEFTGIPAPPFPSSSSSSSPFQRTRLDLFGVRSPPPPPATTTYNLLRPFAQKPQSYQHQHHHQPFLPSFPSSTTIDPSLSSNLSLLKQPTSLNNNNNPLFNFPSSIHLGSSSSHNNSHLKMGVLEEFGFNHVGVTNSATNHISGLHHHHHQNMGSSSLLSGWAERSGTDNNNNNNNDDGGNGGNLLLGDSLSERRDMNKVMNYSSSAASSSDFHGEKAVARSEGMVESWINCSSTD